jgi:hypothetical protein
MQGVKNSKGLTVVIMDDNKSEMPNLSDELYQRDPWFDGVYQIQGKKRGKTVWVPRAKNDRFDQIINTAFAIKSDHSSMVQVADAILRLSPAFGAENRARSLCGREGLLRRTRRNP